MKNLDRIYYKLYNHYGPQNWWPANTLTEMMIGAVLTQNTSWKNVEKALANFVSFELEYLLAIEYNELCNIIIPAGFYKRKASTIIELLNWYSRNMDVIGATDTDSLRIQLLSIKGIGEETCDCIILYGFNRPVFVVDTYLKRLLKKTGHKDLKKYNDIQKYLMSNLPSDVYLFQEYHALIVAYGKDFASSNNNVDDPLNDFECTIEYSIKHLSAILNNRVMKIFIHKLGYVERKAFSDPFLGVVYAVVGQLISTSAANTIYSRFINKFTTVESIIESEFTEVQSVGLTKAKTSTIIDLAKKVVSKQLDFKLIYSMSDEVAIEYLCRNKGIGIWSAKIILMHCYNRLDIAIYEDVALRKSVLSILNIEKIDKITFDNYFNQFSPYKTIACIYHWKYSSIL